MSCVHIDILTHLLLFLITRQLSYFIALSFRRKKIKDIDESKWESNADGTVVRRQPGGSNQGAESGGPYIQK